MTGGDARPRALFERLVETILRESGACHLDGSLVHQIGPLVETDTTDAKSAEQVLAEAFDPARRRLLDYGCGAAHHRPFIEGLGYDWHGVDYVDAVSPIAVEAVLAKSGEITLYDGRRLPFPDRSFDVVYAMLVFQHLQHVDEAFAEVSRVLDAGGRVIGQISSMEQMQDFGTFNFTTFGLKVACEAAGLRLAKVYPKHDVFTFMARRLMITLGASDDNEFTPLLNPDGFVHRQLIDYGRRIGMSSRDINLLRLTFCTQFVFDIVKPAGAP